MSTLKTHLLPVTPYQLYKLQVSDIYEAARAANSGLDFIPTQMGGIFGQSELISGTENIQILQLDSNK